MTRSRRHWGTSPLPTTRPVSAGRMLLLLVVIGLIYSQARKTETWGWLAPEDPVAATALPQVPSGWKETIQPGPTDVEEWDNRETRDKFSAIVDQTQQALQDMPAYWMCLRWALAQSFDQLRSRAKYATMSRLWSEPDAWRGRLVRLKLHVRLIEEHSAPENSTGVKRVYEIWGWTDDSKSLPFCVVVAELPPDMRSGADVEFETEFVGYFLKWLRYTPGVGDERSSPLLLGRIISTPRRAAQSRTVAGPMFGWVIGAAAVVLVGILLVLRFAPRRRQPVAVNGPPRADEASAIAFLETALKPGDDSQPSPQDPPNPFRSNGGG